MDTFACCYYLCQFLSGVAFYRGADCCVLVFDVTQPNTFKVIIINLKTHHSFGKLGYKVFQGTRSAVTRVRTAVTAPKRRPRNSSSSPYIAKRKPKS